jgi:hypothetical protein
MRRRDFIAAAGLGLHGLAGVAQGGAPSGKELYELRLYSFASAGKRDAFDAFLKEAAVPALNGIGIAPVGVFLMRPDENRGAKMSPESLYVLLPHKTPESVLSMTERLSWDDRLVAAGSPVLEAPKDDPAYTRFESSLLLAFDGMPRIAVPSKAAGRILQLRIYESHSVERHVKKVEMFNAGGEIEIFLRTGLNPVFFGQAVIGSKLPNLTYMLGFDSLEAKDAAWKAFGADPAWKRLRSDEAYRDTVSNITNLILRPAASSQI